MNWLLILTHYICLVFSNSYVFVCAGGSEEPEAARQESGGDEVYDHQVPGVHHAGHQTTADPSRDQSETHVLHQDH